MEFDSLGLILIRSQATGANDCSRGLDGDVQTSGTKCFREGWRVRRDHWLAAGQHNVSGPKGQDRLAYLLKAVFCALRIPGCIWRVAPDTSQVAARRADEHRGDTRKRPFALDRVEDLRKFHERSNAGSATPASSNPLRRSTQASHAPQGVPSGRGS